MSKISIVAFLSQVRENVGYGRLRVNIIGVIYVPCRRRIAYNTLRCHLGLSWVARQAGPEVTPFQQSPRRADDRYRRPSIQSVSPPEVAEIRKWLAEAQPP